MKECQEHGTWYFVILKNEITIYPIEVPKGTYVSGSGNISFGYNSGMAGTSGTFNYPGTSTGTITIIKNGKRMTQFPMSIMMYENWNKDMDLEGKEDNREQIKQGWTIKTNKYGKANSKNRWSKSIRPSARRNAYAGR